MVPSLQVDAVGKSSTARMYPRFGLSRTNSSRKNVHVSCVGQRHRIQAFNSRKTNGVQRPEVLNPGQTQASARWHQTSCAAQDVGDAQYQDGRSDARNGAEGSEACLALLGAQ